MQVSFCLIEDHGYFCWVYQDPIPIWTRKFMSPTNKSIKKNRKNLSKLTFSYPKGDYLAILFITETVDMLFVNVIT